MSPEYTVMSMYEPSFDTCLSTCHGPSPALIARVTSPPSVSPYDARSLHNNQGEKTFFLLFNLGKPDGFGGASAVNALALKGKG